MVIIMKTKYSLLCLIAVFLFVISCGTESATQTETTTEISAETAEQTSVAVATQPVFEEESSSAVEETIVVESVDESVAEESEEAKTVEVKIQNYAFEEKTLTVKAGTTVVWENYDSAPHTVTGDGLDSGKIKKGDTYEYTFTKPGTYEYYCAYHPSMTAKVIVE